MMEVNFYIGRLGHEKLLKSVEDWANLIPRKNDLVTIYNTDDELDAEVYTVLYAMFSENGTCDVFLKKFDWED